MITEIENRAATLRGVLSEFDLELQQSTCVDVISEVTRYPNYNSPKQNICGDRKIADQFAGELLEAATEQNYEKFVQRMEGKYRVIYPEREFKNDMEGFAKLGSAHPQRLHFSVAANFNQSEQRHDVG